MIEHATLPISGPSERFTIVRPKTTAERAADALNALAANHTAGRGCALCGTANAPIASQRWSQKWSCFCRNCADKVRGTKPSKQERLRALRLSQLRSHQKP
jgi:hypothetical protein